MIRKLLKNKFLKKLKTVKKLIRKIFEKNFI